MLSVAALNQYYGSSHTLRNVAFEAPTGAVTVILGRNGVGKTTLLKCVAGLLHARSGTIRFDGADITNRSPARVLEAGICYVPQGRNIFPELSVRHNLELGAVMAPKNFDLAARQDAALDRFPVLRRKADAQASTLSGGEQKMLEIARALLTEPKLLLIDEPSIGLSPIVTNELFAALTEMNARGMTVLLIEQNAKRALELSHDGIVLELGRTRIADAAKNILADTRIGQLFLGGGLAEESRSRPADGMVG